MTRLLQPWTAAIVVLLATSPAHAQGPGNSPAAGDVTGAVAYPIDVERAPRPVARALPASTPIEIDGVLGEAAWRDAEVITEFIQAQPRTGHPGSERTEVRFLYDAEMLYVGAFLHDSRPATAMSLEQDYETHDSDVFAVTIDTYLDRRNSFMFLINPLGAIKDGQTFNDSRDINLAWEGVIHVETARADSGWSVELGIPFTTLRFEESPDEMQWGLQILRRLRRTNEDIYWAPVDRRDRIHKMSRAGTLVGLRGIEQGRNFALKPYGKVGRQSSPPPGLAPALAHETDWDVGGDLKWGVTPTLTLDATVNTDFSQTEVDQEQVNLTRFSLFFPERRDFFIENSGVFTFGDVTERNYRMGSSLRDFTLFHSRRIGLVGGQPVPIVAGGRLTGTVGGVQVGLLDMQTRSAGTVPAENFLVTRLRKNVLGSSDVGAIFVQRDATDGGAPTTRSWGVDGNFTFFTNLVVNSYLAGTEGDGSGRAGRLAAAWRDALWDISAFAKTVDDDFTPSVGFVRRRGIREYYGTIGAHPRPKLPLVYGINPYIELDYVTDHGSRLESREGTLGLAVEFADGGSMELKGVDRFERLDAPFAITPSDTIAPGRYGFREATVRYQASGARRFAGSVALGAGEFYNGTKTSVGVGALWRASPRFSLDLRLDHNAVELPTGSFNADVAGVRALVALSRDFFASGFVQYNTTDEQLVTSARLNVIHAPLSDLFLVFVERRDLDRDLVLERTLALKVTKLLAF